MTVRTAAVITLAIILVVTVAELSCVTHEMVSPTGQDASVGAAHEAPSSGSNVDPRGVAVPVIVP